MLLALLFSLTAFADHPYCQIDVLDGQTGNDGQLITVHYGLYSNVGGGQRNKLADSYVLADLRAMAAKVVQQGVCEKLVETKYACGIAFAGFDTFHSDLGKSYRVDTFESGTGAFNHTWSLKSDLAHATKLRAGLESRDLCASSPDYTTNACIVLPGPLVSFQNKVVTDKTAVQADKLGAVMKQLQADGTCTFPAYDFTRPYKITLIASESRELAPTIRVESPLYSMDFDPNSGTAPQYLLREALEFQKAGFVSKIDLSGVFFAFSGPGYTQGTTRIQFGMPTHFGWRTSFVSEWGMELGTDALPQFVRGYNLSPYEATAGCDVQLTGEQGSFAIRFNNREISREKDLDPALRDMQILRGLFPDRNCTLH